MSAINEDEADAESLAGKLAQVVRRLAVNSASASSGAATLAERLTLITRFPRIAKPRHLGVISPCRPRPRILSRRAGRPFVQRLYQDRWGVRASEAGDVLSRSEARPRRRRLASG